MLQQSNQLGILIIAHFFRSDLPLSSASLMQYALIFPLILENPCRCTSLTKAKEEGYWYDSSQTSLQLDAQLLLVAQVQLLSEVAGMQATVPSLAQGYHTDVKDAAPSTNCHLFA